VPDCGVELHHVLPKRALAVQAEDLRVGLMAFAPTANGNQTPIVPNGPELRWPGTKVGSGWRP
jgi:hypothetical protein